MHDDRNGATVRVQLRKKVIHRKAYDKANTGHILDELDVEAFNDIVRDVAGTDDRTVEKYTDLLMDDGVLSESPTGRYKVTEPEGDTLFADIPKTETSTQVKMPSFVKRLADQYGINKSGVFTLAILEEVAMKRKAAERFMPEYSFEEQDYMFRLIAQNLHRRGSTPDDENNRSHQRAKLYEEMVDDIEPYRRAEELRVRAFKLAEQLGVEKKPS